jgi:hypothetical protein
MADVTGLSASCPQTIPKLPIRFGEMGERLGLIDGPFLKCRTSGCLRLVSGLSANRFKLSS